MRLKFTIELKNEDIIKKDSLGLRPLLYLWQFLWSPERTAGVVP